MKNKIFPTLILLFFTQFLMAQNESRVSAKLREMNNDTVRYVKEQIIARKEFYVGKPLDSLLKDLPIPAKRYINTVSNKPYIYPATYIFIYMERNSRIVQKKNPLDLVITWKIPLTKDELTNSGLQSLGGKWTQATYDFFKDKIIGDVGMVKYNF